MFLEESGARRTYKGRLVGAVLGGYLSLRRLVVQRTRLTDDTQEKLLELLEEMTTGECWEKSCRRGQRSAGVSGTVQTRYRIPGKGQLEAFTSASP